MTEVDKYLVTMVGKTTAPSVEDVLNAVRDVVNKETHVQVWSSTKHDSRVGYGTKKVS